jgi:hypothetical protein
MLILSFIRDSKSLNKMPKSNFEQPVIASSSPYVSEEELRRKEYMESKKRWVSNKEFKSFHKGIFYNSWFAYLFSASKQESFIPNYVTMTPSEPPILHKFKSVKKEDWLSGDFKF